jgi:hypothetical protein
MFILKMNICKFQCNHKGKSQNFTFRLPMGVNLIFEQLTADLEVILCLLTTLPLSIFLINNVNKHTNLKIVNIYQKHPTPAWPRGTYYTPTKLLSSICNHSNISVHDNK